MPPVRTVIPHKHLAGPIVSAAPDLSLPPANGAVGGRHPATAGDDVYKLSTNWETNNVK